MTKKLKLFIWRNVLRIRDGEEMGKVREDGFYRVKRCGKWSIAEYRGDIWWMTGSEYIFHDHNFETIVEQVLQK